jgi:hypothetical protein
MLPDPGTKLFISYFAKESQEPFQSLLLLMLLLLRACVRAWRPS